MLENGKSPALAAVCAGALALTLSVNPASAAEPLSWREAALRAAAAAPLAASAASQSSQSAGASSVGEWRPQGVGVGVRAGGFDVGIGISGVGWLSPRLGVEGFVSRFSIGTSSSGGSISGSADFTVMQLGGGLRYRMGDPSARLHPYVGAGLNAYRSSSSFKMTGWADEEESSTDVGAYGVGGLELTFKSIPQLATSLEVGYYTTADPFGGLSVGGISVGASVHWYFGN